MNKAKTEAVAETTAEEPIILEEAVVSAKPVTPGTLRFHHKIPFHGITVYATDITPSEIATIKRTTKQRSSEGKVVVAEQKQLQRELEKLENSDDTEDAEETATRIEAIEARLEEISESQEVVFDAMAEMISEVVQKHVVAISWKKGEKGSEEEVFSREVQFESRAKTNEIGEILITRSRIGMGEFNNLKGR